MVDTTYVTKVYDRQGGDELVVASGGKIVVETGGDIEVNGASLIDEIAALSGLDSGELGVLNGVTAGAVTASKAVVVDANKDIGDFRNLDAVNVDAGASGTAGSFDVFPTTALKGKLSLAAADSAGDTTTTITNASQAGARIYTVPDAGASASFVMSEGAQTVNGAKVFGAAIDTPQAGVKMDGVALSGLKWVDVDVTAALLDGAGTINVLAGVAGDQYKIRDIRLVGGGTNFGAGGDRLIDLTDGTTVWTQIANVDIESAPAATLAWGNAKVPFLTGTSDTASVAGQAIRFVYSGGTTDHGGTGSIKFSVCIEKVA